MNLNLLQSKLISSARAHAPSDRVPYAFEKRIMARLAANPLPDSLTLWAQALWRGTVPCLTLAVLISAAGYFFKQESNNLPTTESTTATANEFNQAFQNSLLAAVDQAGNDEEDL